MPFRNTIRVPYQVETHGNTPSTGQQGNSVSLTIVLASLTCFAGALGYDGSLTNGLQVLPQWAEFMHKPSGTWLGFINATYWIAFGIACPVSAWSANRFGRKKTALFGIVPLTIGTILQTAAGSHSTWIIGRTVLGIPSAIYANVVPLLIAECSHSNVRGILTSMFFTGFYLGATLAAWVTFGTRDFDSSWSWRIPCVLQVVCPSVGSVSLMLCPESPRWLVSVGRIDEARRMLDVFHKRGAHGPTPQQELDHIQVAIEEGDAGRGVRFLDLFKTRPNLHRAAITISLGIFSQWVGNGVVSYYLTLVLDTVGITGVFEQTLISGCLQIWNFLFSVAGAFAVDRLGRRVLFLASFAIMFVSYIAITACSGVFAETGKKSVGLAVVPFIFFFFAGYGVAVTPLQAAYPAEIWPYHLRSQGLSLAFMSMMVGIVFNVFVNPVALEAIGWKYYMVFVVMLLLYGLIIYFLYPETRGYTLEEVTLIFEGQDPTTNNVLEGHEVQDVTKEQPYLGKEEA